jgi:hypothetical protein
LLKIVSYEQITQLPELLQNPLAIFLSQKEEEELGGIRFSRNFHCKPKTAHQKITNQARRLFEACQKINFQSGVRANVKAFSLFRTKNIRQTKKRKQPKPRKYISNFF